MLVYKRGFRIITPRFLHAVCSTTVSSSCVFRIYIHQAIYGLNYQWVFGISRNSWQELHEFLLQ